MGKSGKSSSSIGFLLIVAVLGAILAFVFRPHDTVSFTAFMLASFTPWTHSSSPLFMNYLRSEWEKMPEVEASPMIEFTMANFSRDEMLRLTKNMALPVVIRGAVAETEAVELWSRDHFLEFYPNESVVVREMIDDGFGKATVRMESRTFSEFFLMKDKGRNVSIVASSSVFYHNQKLKDDIRSPIEESMEGPNHEPLSVNQFFITPGGRSWYHNALGNNVFRQIAGQKRWTLISPADNFFMCPKPVISGTSTNPDCLMEMTADQREAFIRRIPRVTALLNPGDVLINSPWWWHDVISVGDKNSPQISVAGRIKNMGATFRNSPMLTAVARKLSPPFALIVVG